MVIRLAQLFHKTSPSCRHKGKDHTWCRSPSASSRNFTDKYFSEVKEANIIFLTAEDYQVAYKMKVCSLPMENVKNTITVTHSIPYLPDLPVFLLPV